MFFDCVFLSDTRTRKKGGRETANQNNGNQNNLNNIDTNQIVSVGVLKAYMDDQRQQISAMIDEKFNKLQTESNKAKKEIVISDHKLKSVASEDQKQELLELISNFDDEIRDINTVGSEELTRYIITVSSEHVRDRSLGKAADGNIKNFKTGLPKSERKENARIHTLKQEFHDKNKATTGLVHSLMLTKGMNPKYFKYSRTSK